MPFFLLSFVPNDFELKKKFGRLKHVFDQAKMLTITDGTRTTVV
jgi:hypothetical protein